MGCNRAFPDAICFFFSDIMFFLVDAMLLVQFVCVSEVMSSQIIQIYKVFTLIFFLSQFYYDCCVSYGLKRKRLTIILMMSQPTFDQVQPEMTWVVIVPLSLWLQF